MEHANIAFGLEADVWDYNNVCVWAIGDKHNTYAKGRCKTREQAKAGEITTIEHELEYFGLMEK
jgi:hypothetical protein